MGQINNETYSYCKKLLLLITLQNLTLALLNTEITFV